MENNYRVESKEEVNGYDCERCGKQFNFLILEYDRTVCTGCSLHFAGLSSLELGITDNLPREVSRPGNKTFNVMDKAVEALKAKYGQDWEAHKEELSGLFAQAEREMNKLNEDQ